MVSSPSIFEHLKYYSLDEQDIATNHLGQPPRCSRIVQLTGRLILRIGRWRLVSRQLPVRNFIVIAAPHTSNWDLLWLLGAAWSLGVHINWLAKASVFRGPAGPVLRAMGGIPVERDGRGKLVGRLSEQLAKGEGLALVIPPEGTRKYLNHWKSGFYRIAENTGVPILCSFLDYKERATGIGPLFSTTANMQADMDKFRAFYEPFTARYPADKSDIRLLDETE